ncbi:hypothetical protein B0H14DRAFT_2531565 [Mycena olivaceomarginata]|nr:hypothetical protein B0H14DRAFT_2531565 [Mycena olivaceomarginata]
MKSSFGFTFATSALLLALSAFPSASAMRQNIEVKARTDLTCGDPSDARPLYFAELENNNDIYTTSITDVTTRVKSQGYTFQGVVARVFVTQEPFTVPWFHLTRVVPSPIYIDDFYTTNATDRDIVVARGFYSYVGITAYIYPSQICGSVPFYRLWDGSTVQHFYTTSLEDRANMLASGTWADEGITGYVLNANGDASVCN